MTFGKKIANSTIIPLNLIQIARIVAVGFSTLVSLPAYAGLIEAAKETGTQATSTRETTDRFDQFSLCDFQAELSSPVSTDDLVVFRSTEYIDDSTMTLESRTTDENVVFGKFYTQTSVDNFNKPLPNLSVSYEPILVTERRTPPKPEQLTSSDRGAQERGRHADEFLDDESSDEELSEDPSEEETYYSMFQNDTFDPLAASAAFLIIGGIALAVNVIPQRSMQAV